MGKLNAKGRKRISKSNFAVPSERKFPIHDISHARNALARASGTKYEEQVKSAVYKAYPSLMPEEPKKMAEVIPLHDRFVKRCEVEFKFPAIKLSDPNAGPAGTNPPIQVLRIGKFNHPKYGEFTIDSATLHEMLSNFEANVRGVDLAVDYFHDSDKEAAAWIKRLYLAEDDSELWAEVDWTPKARTKLAEREVRYFSPDFAFQWTDPESSVIYKNVLFGGGLTNRPFVKDMAAIVASEKQGDIMTEKELKELQAKVLKLSEDSASAAEKMEAMKKEHADMKKKLAEYEEDGDPDDGDEDDKDEGADSDGPAALKKKLAAALAENAKMKTQLAEMGEAKKLAEKESAFNVLLSEGKACAAQKDAFLKGDMTEFVKLSQPLNLEGKGHSGGAAAGGNDREDRVLKLAEEKCKADKSLSLVDAISIAQREIKA